jgi:hypothetical protein
LPWHHGSAGRRVFPGVLRIFSATPELAGKSPSQVGFDYADNDLSYRFP